jgi:hypothetical protein
VRRIFFIFFGAPWLSMNARYEKKTETPPLEGGFNVYLIVVGSFSPISEKK